MDSEDHVTGPTRRQMLALAGVAAGVAAFGGIGLDASPARAAVAWRYPFDREYPVSSGFGDRTPPVGGASSNHQGIDFAAGIGVAIHAVAAGTVITAGELDGWKGFGKLTRIQHADGYTSWYGHQSSIAVGVGTKVSAGQYIGQVGSTGTSSGPHLHLGISTSEGFIDPSFILRAPKSDDSSAPAAPRDDDFALIKSPGRGSAVIGAGYFHALPSAEFEACALVLAGEPIEGNDREFDLWKSIALSGTTAA
ncbi:M23 family metallopeptidase [Curtobacterium sp. MCSS17_015]|uniref:M23 family metallopeptidase n=1 Tax=Curtobacterium sp. MCSS17_015 TaxID=2175666 RepID=UPI0011B65BEC|nr:M23 family metallopeptidase [Curtobacterium sp. MCSS17_015]WIB26574.1 M23 family metallopeptidase [Curtobacterium sp. MCSS17_015]